MIDSGAAVADLLDRALGVALDVDDRVEQPVDGEAARGDRAGDAVDQERHVLVDRDQPHPPAPGFAAGRFDLDRGRALAPDGGGGGDELGGFAQLLPVQAFGLAGKRIARQRGPQGIDYRLRQARMGRHYCLSSAAVAMARGL